jgi:hypothetical protein
MPLLTLAGVALLAGATLAGAALARSTRIPSDWLHRAAALVLAVLVLDLVVHLYAELGASGWPWWSGIAAFAAGFALASALRSVSFGSAAAAIGVHRFVEGAILALVPSPAAIAAFVTHALAEGFAITVPLRQAPHRTIWRWLAVACLSPVAGVLLMPSNAGALQPILAATAAGAIARAALPTKGRATVPRKNGPVLAGFRAAVPGGDQPPESSSSAPSGTRSDSRSSSHP